MGMLVLVDDDLVVGWLVWLFLEIVLYGEGYYMFYCSSVDINLVLKIFIMWLK